MEVHCIKKYQATGPATNFSTAAAGMGNLKIRIQIYCQEHTILLYVYTVYHSIYLRPAVSYYDSGEHHTIV
jgi:hypothetical protein